MIDAETNLKQAKQKDKDGLHKRRGIGHFKLKVGRRWKEYSTHTTSGSAKGAASSHAGAARGTPSDRRDQLAS